MDPLVRIAAPAEPRHPARRQGVRAAASVTAAAEVERRVEGNAATAPGMRREEPAVQLALSEDVELSRETGEGPAGDAAPPRPGTLVDRLA